MKSKRMDSVGYLSNNQKHQANKQSETENIFAYKTSFFLKVGCMPQIVEDE